MNRGAVATGIAHDSHNLIACGVDDESLTLAMNTVRDMKGGVAAAGEGKVIARLSLPIGGLLSDRPLDEVNGLLENRKRAAFENGVCPDIDPFMTLNFGSLPVLPSLRLTTLGAFDVERKKLLE